MDAVLDRLRRPGGHRHTAFRRTRGDHGCLEQRGTRRDPDCSAQRAVPIATTNDSKKSQRLLEAGAAHVLVTEVDDLAASVLDLTGGRGADMVFDAVAGPGVEELVAATAPEGVLFVHGKLSGQPTPLPGLASMRPVYTRPYTVFEITDDPQRLARAVEYIATGVASNDLRPVIDRIFTLDDIVDAHRYLEAGTQVGKIVVTT